MFSLQRIVKILEEVLRYQRNMVEGTNLRSSNCSSSKLLLVGSVDEHWRTGPSFGPIEALQFALHLSTEDHTSQIWWFFQDSEYLVEHPTQQ